MILIFTEAEDVHSDVVEAELRRRGASFCRFDWAEFPRQASLSISFRGGTFVRRRTRSLGGHDPVRVRPTAGITASDVPFQPARQSSTGAPPRSGAPRHAPGFGGLVWSCRAPRSSLVSAAGDPSAEGGGLLLNELPGAPHVSFRRVQVANREPQDEPAVETRVRQKDFAGRVQIL